MDNGMAVILCTQHSTRETAADGAFTYLARQVKACYPRWKPELNDPGPSPAFPGYKMMKFQTLSEETPAGKRAIAVSLVSYVEGGKTIYGLSLGFIVLPKAPGVS